MGWTEKTLKEQNNCEKSGTGVRIRPLTVLLIDFMNLSAKQLHERTASGSQQVRVCFLACFFGKYESACAIFVLKGLLTNFTYLILN